MSMNQIIDSWEDIDDKELENRLEQSRKQAEMAQQQNGTVIIANGNDFRPKILQRPKTVTILKRPSAQGENSNSMLDNNKPKPMKTLEQREKEYAEARLRILGSAVAAEQSADDQNKQPIKLTSNSSSSSSYINYNNNSHQQSQQPIKPPDTIVRYPKGPDCNGMGFNLRR